MVISGVPAASPSGRLLPIIAILAGLTVIGLGGCDRNSPAAQTTPGNATATQVSPTPSSMPATGSGAGATDWCTVAIRIATESGIMVNKHYIPPNQETLDQLKAVVTASLAARDQLLTGIPPDVRSALVVELQYFQALRDSDFSGATPTPAGFDSALKTVNQYQVSTCGVIFDQ